jgi:hypothetical protein
MIEQQFEGMAQSGFSTCNSELALPEIHDESHQLLHANSADIGWRLKTDLLISALRCPDRQREARAEIYKRIESNAATRLAVRYLSGDREEAFDGLVALCWKAKGNLYIQPTINYGTWKERIHQCTHDFIEEFVLEHLHPYVGLGEQEILRAGLEDKFRNLGRRLQSRMIDAVRRQTTRKQYEPELHELSPKDEEACLVGIHGHSCELASRSESSSSNSFFEFLKPRLKRLKQTLGEVGCEVLQCCLEIYPEAYSGTTKQRESALTRAIQQRRNVSAQQARSDKRQFRRVVRRELERDNKDLREIYSCLDMGDDDRTLRVDWVLPSGKKGTFKFPARLSFGRNKADREI